VWRLWLAVCAGYLALGATLQELPIYVEQHFRADPAVAGLAVGLAFAATAACRPFAGRAADADLSRPVVLAGGVLTGLRSSPPQPPERARSPLPPSFTGGPNLVLKRVQDKPHQPMPDIRDSE
jgi:MFS family permease